MVWKVSALVNDPTVVRFGNVSDTKAAEQDSILGLERSTTIKSGNRPVTWHSVRVCSSFMRVCFPKWVKALPDTDSFGSQLAWTFVANTINRTILSGVATIGRTYLPPQASINNVKHATQHRNKLTCRSREHHSRPHHAGNPVRHASLQIRIAFSTKWSTVVV
ncbi:hypothetical protein J6590_027696 [Homalodisca vitripennis]|nr:hypothetical protein J6590_027696 [Homalodisca vitripennis]